MLKFFVDSEKVIGSTSDKNIPPGTTPVDQFNADLEIIGLGTTWSGTGYAKVEIKEVYGSGGLIDKPGSHPLCGVQTMVYQTNLFPFIMVAEFGKIYNKKFKVVKKGSAEISLILIKE